MQHNFFYAESLLVHSRYNYKKIMSFGWFRKSLCLWAHAERRIHNAGWLMWGSGSGAPRSRRQRGLGAVPPAFGNFYNFLLKTTIGPIIFTYLSLNLCLA